MADWISYDADGVISTVTHPVGLGLAEKPNVTIFLEAENAPRQGSKLNGTYVANTESGYSGTGYVTGFETDFNSAQVMVQVAKKMKADLTIRIHAEEDFRADVFVGPRVLNKEWRGMPIKKTDGWHELQFENVDLDAGDNLIRLQAYKGAGLKVDWFQFVPF